MVAIEETSGNSQLSVGVRWKCERGYTSQANRDRRALFDVAL
jgi:hypothetical protein